MKPMIIEGPMLDWVSTSQTGDVCEYFRGNLGYSRNRGILTRQEARLTNDALRFAQSGYVLLFQRRIEQDVCSYLAMRTPLRSQKSVPEHWRGAHTALHPGKLIRGAIGLEVIGFETIEEMESVGEPETIGLMA